MENNGFVGQPLITRQAMNAFRSLYTDEVRQLAMELTHNDETRAGELVDEVFRQAFLRYAERSCPRDSLPYLLSNLCMLFAIDGPNEGDVEAFKQSVGAKESPAAKPAATAPVSPEGPASAAPAQETVPEHAAAAPAPQAPLQADVSADNPIRNETQAETEEAQRPTAAETYRPQHANPSSAGSSQPLYQQVFDPAHTDYWTPDRDENEGNIQGAAIPDLGAAVPDSDAAAPAPSVAAVETAAAAPAPAAEAPNAAPTTSQAYMYNAEVAKKRKVLPLTIANTVLGLLFIWVVVGLLIRIDLLPQWNLGYAWFNLNIFPLF